MYIPPGRYRRAVPWPTRWPPRRYRPCWPAPPNNLSKPFSIFEMENKILMQLLVSVAGAVTVSQMQVPR